MIVQGHDPEGNINLCKPGSDEPDRSLAVRAVACRLVEANLDDETIFAVLTEPSFGISASVREKGDREAHRAIQFARAKTKPMIELAGESGRQHRDVALDRAPHLRRRGWYSRGGQPFTLSAERHLIPVRAPRAVTECESCASFFRTKFTQKGPKTVSTTVNESAARVLIWCSELIDALPEVRAITECPVLLERDGALVPITDYDEPSGILARGEPPATMGWEAGRDVLLDLLRDYAFAELADRARMVAAMLTPALRDSGMVPGLRSPITVLEADDSQAGKGLACKVITRLYGATAGTINQMKGGVGSVRESIDGALLAGRPFVQLDNVRGPVDEPRLESVLTEDAIECRVPNKPSIIVDPRPVTFLMTSNRAELTVDLANRANFVRIRKQPDGYRFYAWPEGGLVEHVEANQTHLLGAVWAILRHWHGLGKPLADDSGEHDFRTWARAVRYIVRDMLGLPDPIAGTRVIQKEKSSPAMGWLRDLAIVVRRVGRMHRDLRASELLDLSVDHGLRVPGLELADDLDDDAARAKALTAVGRRLAGAFRATDTLVVDELAFVRRESPGLNAHGKHDRTYRVVEAGWSEPDEVPFA